MKYDDYELKVYNIFEENEELKYLNFVQGIKRASEKCSYKLFEFVNNFTLWTFPTCKNDLIKNIIQNWLEYYRDWDNQYLKDTNDTKRYVWMAFQYALRNKPIDFDNAYPNVDKESEEFKPLINLRKLMFDEEYEEKEVWGECWNPTAKAREKGQFIIKIRNLPYDEYQIMGSSSCQEISSQLLDEEFDNKVDYYAEFQQQIKEQDKEQDKTVSYEIVAGMFTVIQYLTALTSNLTDINFKLIKDQKTKGSLTKDEENEILCNYQYISSIKNWQDKFTSNLRRKLHIDGQVKQEFDPKNNNKKNYDNLRIQLVKLQRHLDGIQSVKFPVEGNADPIKVQIANLYHNMKQVMNKINYDQHFN